jgi:hypothetical protein
VIENNGELASYWGMSARQVDSDFKRFAKPITVLISGKNLQNISSNCKARGSTKKSV